MNKQEQYKIIIANINYLFDKINWGASFLDSRAIQIMNNLSKDIKLLLENK